MNKNELIALLDKVPDDAEIYVCVNGEDCYPAKVNGFYEAAVDITVIYFHPKSGTGNHLNFPKERLGRVVKVL